MTRVLECLMKCPELPYSDVTIHHNGTFYIKHTLNQHSRFFLWGQISRMSPQTFLTESNSMNGLRVPQRLSVSRLENHERKKDLTVLLLNYSNMQ